MSLLSNGQLTALTGAYNSLFDQLSSGNGNFISVVKKPIQIINNSQETVLMGYLPESADYTSISYLPVTGIYPAIIFYPGRNHSSNNFGQLKFTLDENDIYIKVKQDARDFLKTERTEYIIIDGISYNMEMTDEVQNYYGLKFYIFKLTSSK